MSNLSGHLTRGFWWSVGISFLFNSFLLAWLLLKPGTHAQFAAVDNIVQALGLLLGALLCFASLKGASRHSMPRTDALSATQTTRRWLPLLFGLGSLSMCIGQSTYTYYEQILHLQPAPFPSWADAGYLGVYPFLLFGIMLIPTRPLSNMMRSRVVLDGLMIMTAMITFSWYFILGPITLQGYDTLFAKLVGAAYPFSDLVMVFCLLLLISRSNETRLRPALYLLTLGLTIIVLTDSIYDYQTLQNAYATGGLIDLGWPLGYILIGLAVQAMRLTSSGQAPAAETASGEKSSNRSATAFLSIWRSFLPYVLVPIIVLIAVYVWHTGDHSLLAQGVYPGGAVLIGLMLVRQILAIREAQQLNESLRTANSRWESMATTDPLTGLPNHRSLLEQLDKEMERTRRYGHTFSIVFFDGDRFKRVNDTYGHAVGDVVLRELGVRVHSALRAGDTLGRYGGEEFMVILPETNSEHAVTVAERMRAAVAVLPLATAQVKEGINTTISLGISTYPEDAATSSELLQKADRAMYWAKRLGRNQVRTATEAQRASQDMALDITIHALERDDDTSLDSLQTEQVLHDSQLSAVYSLMWILELRDHGMSTHSYEVSDLAAAIAKEMGLDQQVIMTVSTAGLLHDIGKIAIPDILLQKAGSLSSSEWTLIKQHPELGAQILEVNPFLRDLMPAVHYHHERWNGTGYPEQLAGENIPLEARIIAVAEAYQAIVTDRPYQAGRSPANALGELQRCAGTQFDPAVVQAASSVLTRQHVQVEASEIAGVV